MLLGEKVGGGGYESAGGDGNNGHLGVLLCQNDIHANLFGMNSRRNGVLRSKQRTRWCVDFTRLSENRYMSTSETADSVV